MHCDLNYGSSSFIRRASVEPGLSDSAFEGRAVGLLARNFHIRSSYCNSGGGDR